MTASHRVDGIIRTHITRNTQRYLFGRSHVITSCLAIIMNVCNRRYQCVSNEDWTEAARNVAFVLNDNNSYCKIRSA